MQPSKIGTKRLDILHTMFLFNLLTLAVLVLDFLDIRIAHAINRPQLFGFSAESTALAGAGHVVIADTSAINTVFNPGDSVRFHSRSSAGISPPFGRLWQQQCRWPE